MIEGLCQENVPQQQWPYERDWIVDHIEPSTRLPNHVFVAGVNLNYEPGWCGRRFAWIIPLPLSWRYDLSAVCAEEATHA